jgi:mannose/fructose/N-acetylgalactosamine-specific phosphotransferase system component IIC
VSLLALPWPAWIGLAGLGAWLALDDTSVGQTWFSQPLPAAVLTGLVLGEPGALLLPGLLLQLVVMGNLPVGASFRLDEAGATVGVLAGSLVAGWQPPSRVFSAAAWSGPAAEQLGWLVTLTVTASLLGGWLVHVERQRRLSWMLDGYRSVRDGDLARLEGLHRRSLVVTALRGTLVTLIWALVAAWLWELGGPARLAAPLRGALELLPLLVPALAVGSVAERFGPRRAWPLVSAGAAVGLLVAWLAL